MWRATSILIAIVFFLLILGVVMLYSTSEVLNPDKPYYYLNHQLLWVGLGIIACAAAALVDYTWWRRLAVPLALFAIILLVMAIAPGVGVKVKGSSRWLRFGGVSVQPSELAKFATVVMLAWWMARVQHRAEDLKLGMIIPGLFLGSVLGLIFIEPDFGTTILVAVVGLIIMFVGGTRISYLLVAAISGLAVFAIAVMQDPERMRRIVAFANPEKYAQDEAYQLLSAIYAFVVGGPTGVGLGQSLQKHFYLPEAHTDFIFAIIGEELGLVATLGVVLLNVCLLVLGLRISFLAPDRFGKLLGLGITLMLNIQAAINICVVTGTLPTKGLPLPFISFGGSSMVVSLLMLGVLINLSRRGGAGAREESKNYIQDREHDL